MTKRNKRHREATKIATLNQMRDDIIKEREVAARAFQPKLLDASIKAALIKQRQLKG